MNEVDSCVTSTVGFVWDTKLVFQQYLHRRIEWINYWRMKWDDIFNFVCVREFIKRDESK